MQPDSHTTRDVWRHYVATKSLPDSVLRDPIHRAWRRCDLVGASPLVARAYEIPESQSRPLFEQEKDLIQAARPFMEALSQAAGNERHAAMLGDRNSTVLDVVGDEESVHGRERVPGPGALLSEALAGANGIGSPLAEGGYIELVGPEHFIEGFHPFTCQGLPLYGPEGETIGVLSTSVRRVEASRRIQEILICAARGIEAELMRRRLASDVARLLATPSADAPLLEQLEQDIVQLQGAARLRLEKAVRLVPTDRHPDALRLMETATELITRFRKQSQVWRDLASLARGEPQFLDLGRQTSDMVLLLATEATVRGVELEVVVHTPTEIFADPRELRRALFRVFLRAFEASQPRNTLRVEVSRDDRHDLGIVRFPAVPDAVLVIPGGRQPPPAGQGFILEVNNQ